MSESIPPNPIPSLTNFNSNFFSDLDGSLTLAAADLIYLKLSGGVVYGLTTFSNSLNVVGTLSINGSAIDLSLISGVVAGTPQNSKALSLDATGKINGGITMTGTMSALVSTSTTLTVNGVDVGSNIAPLVGITLGTPAASKVLTLNASSQIAGSLTLTGNLAATDLIGTLQTAAQTNITSLGTLSSLIVSGLSSTSNTRMTTTTNYNGVMDTASLILKQASVTNGNKIGLDFMISTNDIDAVNTATCSIVHERLSAYVGDLIFLTKRTATATNPLTEALRISSTGTCSIANTSSGFQLNLGASGTGINTNALTTTSLTLGATAITATGIELNYLDLTTGAGTAEASKALVLDSSSNISGIVGLSATNITGTLQTAAQPNITSIGTLNNLNVTGTITSLVSIATTMTCNGIDVGSNLAPLVGITLGAPAASKALTLNASSQIAGSLTLTGNLTATNLTGTLQTAAQPNITSIGTLTSLTATSITGTLQTAAQPNITSIGTLTGLTSAGQIFCTNIISSNSYSTSGVSSKVASLYGHQAFGSINTNGSYVSAGISFLNASSDQMPQASIVLDRKALDQGDLCIYTQSPTFNLSETARFLSTGALSINTGASPIAMISCIGSGSYLYGTQYQRLLHLKSNHATPVKFEVSLNKNTAATSTNECLVGTTTANDLYIGTDSTYRMCIKATTNYVGIGDNASSIDKVFGILNGTVGSGIVDMRFGNALSTNNCFTMTYAPTSSGSSSNRLQFDPYGSSGALTILAKKYIGIATTSPVCPLDVAGSESGLGILAPYQYAGATSGDGGYVASGTTTGVNINAIFRSNVIFDDKIYIRSDRRLKKDIAPLEVEQALRFVNEVDPVFYRKRDQPETSIQEIGYIAQDVMKAGFGNLITHTDNDKMHVEQEGDIENIQFNVEYTKVCAVLHAVIRDQQKRIEQLERLSKLKKTQ